MEGEKSLTEDKTWTCPARTSTSGVTDVQALKDVRMCARVNHVIIASQGHPGDAIEDRNLDEYEVIKGLKKASKIRLADPDQSADWNVSCLTYDGEDLLVGVKLIGDPPKAIVCTTFVHDKPDEYWTYDMDKPEGVTS